LFAVATAPLSVVVLLGGAIAQATLRPAAESFESGTFGTFRGLATRITLAQVGLAAACTVFFGLFGERLLTTLFAPDYGVGAPILTIMSAGLMISGLGAFGSAVLAAGRMWWLQCANVAIALAAHIPLCYYLIGASATRGAAWAEVGRMLVSTLFLAVAGWWAFRRQRSRSTASPPDPQPGGGDGIHT
jgi:O-antigen/teichoic acid export membrane protein